MNDMEKIGRLELALRMERDVLRKAGGPDNVTAANAINSYLQNSDTDSKLRFANILLDAPGDGTQTAGLRAV